MKTVRVWFKKGGAARYISHLDLNRCMSLAIHKARIPLWYTQGFNPHAFLTFALPLSLGVQGERESMDFRLDDDDMTEEELVQRFNDALPADIRVFAVTEPVMKPGKIAWASYEMLLEPEGQTAQELAEALQELFSRSELIVPKHTKKGMIDWDIRSYLNQLEITVNKDLVQISAILPAGSTVNVNPGLLLEAMKKYLGLELYVRTKRTNLYNDKMEVFQ